MGKITAGKLKEVLRDIPDDVQVHILFETGFCQFVRAATDVVSFGSSLDRLQPSFFITHELDCLPRAENQCKEFNDYELIADAVLTSDNYGLNEPELHRQFIQNCRERWAKWWKTDLPIDCKSCGVGTLLPIWIDGEGIKWECSKAC